MLSHENMKGIVKTICDGLKDAGYQMEWAEAAREHGHNELALLHANEAKKRLDGVKEWYDKARALFPMEKHTELEEMLMHHYKSWYRDLREKVEMFHKS